MPVIKILHGQSLADIADEEALFDAADLNGIGITDDLTAGSVLEVPRPKRRALTSDRVRALTDPISQVNSLPGQTWVDMVLQQLGEEERLFELADHNGVGITDDLVPGSAIKSPEFTAFARQVVKALDRNKPASLTIIEPGGIPEEGIEFWAIEYDFIVS